MSKHTPKPWVRVADSIKSRTADCVVVRLPELTDCWGDESPEQLERWNADARLIAAAPELLEALEKVVSEYIKSLYDSDRDLYLGRAMNAAEKAIAKAKGEE